MKTAGGIISLLGGGGRSQAEPTKSRRVRRKLLQQPVGAYWVAAAPGEAVVLPRLIFSISGALTILGG
jgi:hypothetical protein